MLWRIVLAMFAVTLLVGCGDGIPISGNVSLDGEPLSSGVIKFVPSTGMSARTASTQISKGEYSFGSADGPLSGQYIVEIYKDEPLPEGLDDPAEFARKNGRLQPPRNTVAARFNRESILRVEITSDGNRQLDYEVTGY